MNTSAYTLSSTRLSATRKPHAMMFTATIETPAPVQRFFGLCSELGAVTFAPHWDKAKVVCDVSDLYSLADLVRATAAKAGPEFGERVAIPRPDTEGNTTIGLPHIVDRYFSILTSLTSVEFDPAAPSTTAVTFDADDEWDLANLVNNVVTELDSEHLNIEFPRPATTEASALT